jgi:Hypothetical glycosyl hydrolase family 15
MTSAREASYTWDDSFILSHATQGLMVHWADPWGTNLMGRAASLLQKGMPVSVLYSFPMMSSDFTPWGATLTEDMFLHNGGNTPDRRVRHSPDELQTVLDPGNPAYAKAIASLLAGIVKDNGLSGLLVDGILNNLTLKYIYDWIVPPTQEQIDAWPSRLPTLYSALKQALGSKLLISNTSDPGAHPDLVAADDAIIDIVDGTLMEGWLTNDWGTLSNQGYAIYKTALARAKLKGKILWLLNLDRDRGVLVQLYGIYLLDAGPNLWFGADQVYDQTMLDLFARDLGPPLGNAVQQADGTWVREFQNLIVRANPSDASHGGMWPWTSTLTWKPKT